MTRVTRFSARDDGPATRIAGFVAHLRANGFRVGPEETRLSVDALSRVMIEPETTRLALQTVLCGCREERDRFPELFTAYWMNNGRVREKIVNSAASSLEHTRTTRKGAEQSDSTGTADSPEDGPDGEADTYAEGTGKLVASDLNNLMKKDLREVVSPDDIREAEAIARRLGAAIRRKRSRRARIAAKCSGVDFRRTIRRSLASGGEPLHIIRRKPLDRPLRIAALCDVSGSMTLYARPFLAFLAGLMRADHDADAYLFHTRLVRITEALRDDDPMRALNRITLLADGFGGGSRIGGSLDQFSRTYARRFVDGRTVLMVLSDGYDSADPELISEALQRLSRRGCRIIWLNPLKGWTGYEPVARGMAAALPHLDLFAAANTLADLASLEKELTRL
ncbi:VWA domain-containing protein [Marivivens donghaensis]|uniref:VWA domain-containing protein n=1 Tax=Marivivens donghaensis TaxID=1699413 RepID=A0ABX0VZC3_9RHOB|nr:VWA domain-containing protein [Marivivens donghaensis]NIY73448.1 VWA domain-containing protein [Marivivens donghaensis]